MTPTPEQNAIISTAKETEDNLLVTALAGAAKTSTLVLVAEALPSVEILCLAFNKRIATEMQQRLPDNCRAATLNSLGHRTWQEAIGRRLRIDPGKGYANMKYLIDGLTDPTEKSEAYDRMAELMRIVSFGKACGYIPTGTYDKAKRLMEDEGFFPHLEQKLSPLEQDLIRSATLLSLKQAFEGLCDYDDQILMPTVFHGAFPRYKLTLVDEAQDLSALNHAMLRKMVKTRRLIAVGDQNQAIYGFRGAHEDSMDLLSKEFSMREMVLSISFRCPIAVVEHVHWKTPHMKYPEWAAPGHVTSLTAWSAAELPESAAIICRNNAPLFALAIKLLKAGRHAEIGGNDTAKGIMKIMRKFGSSDMKQAQVFDAIDAWRETELSKNRARAASGITDRAECMRIFAGQGDTLGDSLAYAQHLCQMHSPLKLLTGHKAKGLEFDHVFFLDQDLIGREEQESNLRYVIQTRAKETLIYVTSKDFAETVGTYA